MPAVSGASVPAWTAADARAVTRLMLIVVALRVATAVLAFYGNVTFPLARPEQFTVFETTDHFWDTFARNDSGWYLGIASRGYRWVPNGRGNLAFFPAYPLLMRAAGRVLQRAAQRRDGVVARRQEGARIPRQLVAEPALR